MGMDEMPPPQELPGTGELQQRDVLIHNVRGLRQDIVAYKEYAKLLLESRERLYRAVVASVFVILIAIGGVTTFILDARTTAVEEVAAEACERHREVRDIFIVLIGELLGDDGSTSDAGIALMDARDQLMEDPCPTEDL